MHAHTHHSALRRAILLIVYLSIKDEVLAPTVKSLGYTSVKITYACMYCQPDSIFPLFHSQMTCQLPYAHLKSHIKQPKCREEGATLWVSNHSALLEYSWMFSQRSSELKRLSSLSRRTHDYTQFWLCAPLLFLPLAQRTVISYTSLIISVIHIPEVH